ncbi:HD domain-containing protein [Xenorhabdus sp. PB30.3]|uniref:HD domain-containing protein n=1 Tax=Xenorhabdus sp. PB30.3 TaxID=2788941 RepID=UPI001E5C35B0|nr:HD domain-containing protein [Xenorhabdus sp. PB30.3]MCC8381937.1 HD domain-containing protein [Xenorhabdus sp. PB30.3]
MSIEKKIINNDVTIQEIVRHLINSYSFKEIIYSDAFTRLQDISFLGAIDYSEKQYILNKSRRTRHEHSLYVAALSFYISVKRNYSEETTKNIVAAALLHDIGHLPLSHSAEPTIKKIFGIGHHEIGNQIINGEVKKLKNLNENLKNKFDIEYIFYLLNTKDKDKNNGSDLFSSQINIDTIDGIIRCLEYKNLNSIISLNRLNIASASFLDEENLRIGILDNFWKTKDFVYKNMINNNFGIIPDKISEFFFIENSIHESMLFSNEEKWKYKFKNLFKRLRNNEIKNSLKDYCFEITNRNYYINNNELNIPNRYLNTKTKEKMTPSHNFCVEKKQLNLFGE